MFIINQISKLILISISNRDFVNCFFQNTIKAFSVLAAYSRYKQAIQINETQTSVCVCVSEDETCWLSFSFAFIYKL